MDQQWEFYEEIRLPKRNNGTSVNKKLKYGQKGMRKLIGAKNLEDGKGAKCRRTFSQFDYFLLCDN